MTRIDPELERSVRSWLQDGVNTLPDHVFDALVDGYPTLRQRRIGWWPADPGTLRRLVAVAAVLVLAVTLVGLLLRANIGDDEPDRSWHRLPSVYEAPLAAGRVLVDEPFPVRIGLTVPDGWTGNPIRGTLAHIGRDEGGAGLSFTFVDEIYADPCHLDRGLLDPPVGASADDLASALASRPGLTVSGPVDTLIDGVPALAVTLTAPAVFEGCTTEPQAAPYTIWSLPEWHWLDPGERNRLWILEVGGTRLVISAEEFQDSSPAALAELNAIVSSIDLDPVVESVVDPSEAPAPTVHALPTSGTLPPADYAFDIQLHRFVGDLRIPLRGRHTVTISVEEAGWSSVGSGIERPGGGDATVGVGAWSIARIYADPCHWRSADAAVDPADFRTVQGLADTLARWGPGASEPIDAPRYGRYGQFVELTIPPEIDLSDCDGGEYRLWEDASGRPRSARAAGEAIGVYVVDADPGLLVVDAWTLPAATPGDRDLLGRRLLGIWLLDPAPESGE